MWLCCCGTCESCGSRLLPVAIEGIGFRFPDDGIPCQFDITIDVTCSSDGFDDRTSQLTGTLEIILEGEWTTENTGGVINDLSQTGTQRLDFGLFCSGNGDWYVTGSIPGESVTEGCFTFVHKIQTPDIFDCGPPMTIVIEDLCSETNFSTATQLNDDFSCCGAGMTVCACDDDPSWTRTDPTEEANCVTPPDPPPGNCDPCEVILATYPASTDCCCDVCMTITIVEIELEYVIYYNFIDDHPDLSTFDLSEVTNSNSTLGTLYAIYCHDSGESWDTSIYLFSNENDRDAALAAGQPYPTTGMVAKFEDPDENFTGTATFSEVNSSGITTGSCEVDTNGGGSDIDEKFTVAGDACPYSEL